MAKKSNRVEELEDAVEDNYTVATEEYSTKAEMQAALDRIADACVDVIPGLDESEPDEIELENEDEEN